MVKCLALSLQPLGSLLWHKFDPWPGSACTLPVQPKGYILFFFVTVRSKLQRSEESKEQT